MIIQRSSSPIEYLAVFAAGVLIGLLARTCRECYRS